MKPIRRLVARVVLAAAGATLVGRALPAQAPANGSAVAFGYVTDQFGQPVEGAELLVVRPDRTVTTRTSEAGAYRLDSIAAGVQQLRVRRAGYLPRTIRVEMTAGDMQSRDFTLVKLPFALDAAVVQTPDGELRASFADFAARRARGVGMFIDRAEIDRRRPAAATDLIRAVKGFRLLEAGNGSYRLVGSSEGATNACAVRFFVDGFPYAPVDGLDDFDPEQIGALEAYGVGEAPPPLDQVASPCGVVVVWLRR